MKSIRFESVLSMLALFLSMSSYAQVGIGTTTPISMLEINGAVTNVTAFNTMGSTTIDFTKSNMAYSSANAGAFTLNGLKDGGTYTLAVQGGTSGICSFTGSNPSGTAFVFKSTNNGSTVANKQTLYTFLVMGTTIYFYMVTGF
jgi:hypothetical protein